jgi:hypothetical protein
MAKDNKTNRLGIACLIFGILSLLFGWFPVFGWGLIITTWVLVSISLKKNKNKLAIAGLVLSIIGLLFAGLTFYGILNYEQPKEETKKPIEINKEEPIKEEVPIEKKVEVKTEPTIIKEEVPIEIKTEVVDDCPQFKELVMKYSKNKGKNIVLFNKYSAYSEKSENVKGWKIQGGWNYIGDRFFVCHKGNKVGQNVENYYCGDDVEIMSEVKKKVIDKYGNIIEILRKEMILVFDGQNKFVKTICK